jgi:hypothetical protein
MLREHERLLLHPLVLAALALWALNFTVSKYVLEEGFRPLARR